MARRPASRKPNTGLTKWFNERWVDVKTGKACGRSGAEKKKRGYPACRPAKTAAKMTAAQKRSVAAKKQSSARVKWPVTPSGKRRKR